MPGNIEIKARVNDLEDINRKALSISEEHFSLNQTDTFFGSVREECRLKLRYEHTVKTKEIKGCLIGYERPNIHGPKLSRYILVAAPDPEGLEKVLAMSNGITGKVEKKREVYIVKRNSLTARVHIDIVKYLGTFIEFEVIVDSNVPSQIIEGEQFANYLKTHFKLAEGDFIDGSYLDLLQAENVKKNLPGKSPLM